MGRLVILGLGAALAGCGDAPATDGGSSSGGAAEATSGGDAGAPTSGGETGAASSETTDATEASSSTTTTTTGSTGSEGSSSSGDSSTGDAPGCGSSPPCEACVCGDAGWACDCPPLAPEAGYIDIEPVSFVVGTPGKEHARTSDAARIFYSFRPADDVDAGGPLFVLFNGGPGVSTGILMGFGTGPVRIDDGAAVANPGSWTSLGDLLYIDARDTGLSYLRSDMAVDLAARQKAFDIHNFNVFFDAADYARVILRFLTAHPQLLKRRVVLVGESYGGTRATALLNLLLFRAAYDVGGAGRYHDPALVAELEQFLGVRDPEVEDWSAEAVSDIFPGQVLIQPGLGDRQRDVAGDLLEQPGSPVFDLAAELGLNYVTCASKPPGCEPWDNAVTFIEGTAQRSRYDLEAASSWLADSFAVTRARLSDLDLLAAVLAVPPAEIAGILPADRGDAFRMGSPGSYPADGGDISSLGPLTGWDRYYLPFVAEANVPFRSPLANFVGVGAGDDHVMAMFLHNLVYVDTFVTAASRDVAIYAPSIPVALSMFNNEVADVLVGPGEFTVDYTRAPFPGEPGPGARTVRFPAYDASHSVGVDQAVQLRDDVGAWLAEL
ncbi:MAG: hypothetical protein JNL82_09525 [Myxococcales bacterium]|nr:hypothetical protein [Myxococcales bacterium]